jgi:membrane protein implicated in regulation of membrane protease activity
MKHIVLALQIAALTASWSSNRADAMAAAAIFAVLCVVAVVFKRTFSDTTGSTRSRSNG